MNVACKTCARVEMTDGKQPVYCDGEGTFHAGHIYRMMTADELRARLTMPHVQRYPVAVERTEAAIRAIEEVERQYQTAKAEVQADVKRRVEEVEIRMMEGEYRYD